MFMDIVFSLEMLLIYISFGLQLLGHLGYMTDIAVIASQLYWNKQGVGREARLFNLLRLWRVLRLFAALVQVEKEQRKGIEEQVEVLQEKLKTMETEKESLAIEITKEKEARMSIESMLVNYKEEVDTLNEALKIAAMDIAEVGGAGGDGGEDDDFSLSNDGDEGGEEEDEGEEGTLYSGTMSQQAMAKKANNNRKKNIANDSNSKANDITGTLRDLIQSNQGIGGDGSGGSVTGGSVTTAGRSSTTFIVKEDGQFELK